MEDLIQFNEEDTIDNNEIIKVRNIYSVNNLDDIATHFRKELKQMELEDLVSPDVTIRSLMYHIKSMRPNRILMEKDKSFLVIDCDISIDKYIVIRGKKLIASGHLDHCKKVIMNQLQKEFRSKTESLSWEIIDEQWLLNFCHIHYSNPKTIKLINVF